jgi:hypothetical protein
MRGIAIAKSRCDRAMVGHLDYERCLRKRCLRKDVSVCIVGREKPRSDFEPEYLVSAELRPGFGRSDRTRCLSVHQSAIVRMPSRQRWRTPRGTQHVKTAMEMTPIQAQS